MHFYLLILDMDQLNTIEKASWGIAIIATCLLLILEVMSFLGQGKDSGKRSEFPRIGDARTVLLFFTFLGWSSILVHLWIPLWPTVLLIGVLVGLFTASLPKLISRFRKKKQRAINQAFKMDQALKSTGEVLAYNPSGRGGKGKVHLNLRSAPYQVDAVSNGRHLPVGSPVRVVEIVDGRILVVEPLTGGGSAPDMPRS